MGFARRRGDAEVPRTWPIMACIIGRARWPDRGTGKAMLSATLRVLRASARIHLFCTPAEAGAQLGDAKDEAHDVITTTFPTGPRPSPEYQGAMR